MLSLCKGRGPLYINPNHLRILRISRLGFVCLLDVIGNGRDLFANKSIVEGSLAGPPGSVYEVLVNGPGPPKKHVCLAGRAHSTY